MRIAASRITRARGCHATAETLMRSRYCAFALGNAAYLIDTWHPSTRPARLDLTPDQEWLALSIHAGSTNADDASVEFTARSRIGGRSHVLHEVSRFVREGGRWYYVAGAIK